GGHDLDGDDLAVVAVAPLVNGAHAALGDLLQQIVITDGLHRRLRGLDPHRRGLPCDKTPRRCAPVVLHDSNSRTDRTPRKIDKLPDAPGLPCCGVPHSSPVKMAAPDRKSKANCAAARFSLAFAARISQNECVSCRSFRARPDLPSGGVIMSIFGKVLAFFNILGMVFLFFMALMTYSRREAWMYANFLHDVALYGIALNREEHAPQGNLVYLDMPKQLQKQLFPTEPVWTQKEEVQRVQQKLQKKVNDAGGQEQQSIKYATILL